MNKSDQEEKKQILLNELMTETIQLAMENNDPLLNIRANNIEEVRNKGKAIHEKYYDEALSRLKEKGYDISLVQGFFPDK